MPGSARPIALQFGVERGQISFGHPAQHDILLDGGAHVIPGVLAGDVRQLEHLRRGDVAQRQIDVDDDVIRLALLVNVGLIPVVEAVRDAPAPFSEKAGLRRDFAIGRAVRSRYSVQRSSGGSVSRSSKTRRRNSSMPNCSTRNLRRARLRFFFSPRRAKTRAIACASGRISSSVTKSLEQLGRVRDRPQTAADVHGEAALELAIDLFDARQQAEVVDVDQPAGVLLAAGESRLEFASEILRIGVTEQEIRHRFGVGRDVEGFVVANARQRAAGDIADGVAAGFLRGDADRRQTAHQVGRVFDMDVVQLEILPSGDVQNAIRILVGDFRQHFHLLRRRGRRTGS